MVFSAGGDGVRKAAIVEVAALAANITAVPPSVVITATWRRPA
jgi:hypothetical protein